MLHRLLIASLLLLVLPAVSLAAERPNILFLFADDQRTDTIAAWGNPHIQTPNLDRLVARGCSFRNNYCCGANGGAVCVPSRAMLMSGRRWLDIRLDLAGSTLLPEVLRAAGYETFATGKWHNGGASLLRAFPDARSMFVGGMEDHHKLVVHDISSGRPVRSYKAEKYSTTQFADTAIEFLERKRGEQPFFCYVAFTSPHDPRDPPDKYKQMYYDKPPPLPKNFLPAPQFDNGFIHDNRDENLAPYPRPREVIRDQLCEYYGMVSHLDHEVGRVLDALEKSGQAKNTIVIYAADHGLAVGSHGLMGKQSLYEHSMKCPLIIAGPDVPAGKSFDAFTYLLDLFPTIAGFSGAKPPENLAGSDLRPLIKGEKRSLRDAVFLPYANTMRSVRNERWKVIYYPQINHRELFDLAADPDEINNIAEDPKFAEHLDQMTELLKSWQSKAGDPQTLAVLRPLPKKFRYDDFVRLPDPWQPPWIVDKYFKDSPRLPMR